MRVSIAFRLNAQLKDLPDAGIALSFDGRLNCLSAECSIESSLPRSRRTARSGWSLNCLSAECSIERYAPYGDGLADVLVSIAFRLNAQLKVRKRP